MVALFIAGLGSWLLVSFGGSLPMQGVVGLLVVVGVGWLIIRS